MTERGPVQNVDPSTENNAPRISVDNQGGEPHAVTQHREVYGVGPTVSYSGAGEVYAQVSDDVDLDKVVESADLSSGPGHRIQVQGVDAPPPAVASFGRQSIVSFINGVPPTEEQIAEQNRNITSFENPEAARESAQEEFAVAREEKVASRSERRSPSTR